MQPSAATMSRLKTLIGFPTISCDSNLGLIEWVRDELRRHGVTARLTYDGTMNKANLFATIGEGSGGLVLSGHTDVVPVSGQDWHTDPFKACVMDGRLYGRGAADMKGFLAVVLASISQMLIEAKGAAPFHLALSYDEEVGCLGVPGLLEDLERAGVRPSGCIIGEPTNMNLVVGHKGASLHRCKVRGRPAHSSLAPQGVNAISCAAALIAHLERMGARIRSSEPSFPAEIPYTTFNVGVISGGTVSNIVAQNCEFRFDIRHIPGTSPQTIIEELELFAEQKLLPEMRAVAPEASIQFEHVGGIPAFAVDAASPLAVDVKRLVGRECETKVVDFGTEAGLYQNAGIPTIVCGPGSIAQAHKPDEYIALEQLARCELFLQSLIRERH